MTPATKYTVAVFAILTLPPAFAEERWIDEQYRYIHTTLDDWSQQLDEWFGEVDPNNPASATLRLILDNDWNRYDGYRFKPRVRANIKLPTLKQRLKNFSLVLGDDDLDNTEQGKKVTSSNTASLKNEKKYDRKQARTDNASLALRWSHPLKQFGIETDLDLGVRSGVDVFLRGKISKAWQLHPQWRTQLTQSYRYGIKSRHFLRTHWETQWKEAEQRIIHHNAHLQYTHHKNEMLQWGDSLYRQHRYVQGTLNYGVAFGGEIEDAKMRLNYYGPFINWRQTFLRQWFYFQPELHYYNDKPQHRKHTLGASLRLEAIF